MVDVGIIMGSSSDLPVMDEAAAVLTELGVPFERRVVSAHRSPLRMVDYARSARERGLRVIIAGAGGAAHLPGMVASLTTLPVIGVPVPTRHLGGVDSLHSIVQMPGGVPVATMAIGGARNAGLMAVRILAVSDDRLAALLAEDQLALERYAADQDAELNPDPQLDADRRS
jgi:5-(carboxyamino)imidazole ribonucleotide mutase